MPLFQPPASGGSGDVVGPATSVDGEIALFSGATGKLLGRAGAGTAASLLLNGATAFSSAPFSVKVGTNNNFQVWFSGGNKVGFGSINDANNAFVDMELVASNLYIGGTPWFTNNAFYFVTDNAGDIGQSANYRPRTIYAGTSLAAPRAALSGQSATVAPLSLTAGTLMTTAEDGALEIDANCIYGCTDTGNRGIIPIEHIIRADSTRTFVSNTSQQAIFTTPASGELTLETGCYLFEGLIAMNTMSATSGNGKFSLIGAGTATLAAILWQAYGNDNSAEATGANIGGSWHIIAAQTGTNIMTAAVGTGACILIKGTFEVSVAGTIIPSFAQTTASAAVVQIGSYFRCNRIGSTDLTSVGQWS